MGKTQRNNPGKRGPRGGVIKGERITRSSKAKLTNGLDDPAQVEKELNAQLRLMGLYAANTTGDGNCLFRALSDQLYGFSSQHARLRQETCDHLAASPEKYAGFVDDKPFDEYVRLMRESGTYGGHLELSAFAQLKQKQIKIVQPGLVYVVSCDDDSPDAVRAREAKESERERIQNSLAPGAEGPPPSEREQRRLRREESRAKRKSETDQPAPNRSSETSSSSPSPGEMRPAESAHPDVLVEAYGPLYIAYHNWEHYSSIRNLGGPHTGLPRIKEKFFSGEASKGKGKGKALASAGNASEDWVEDSDPEPTEEESLVMKSTSGSYSVPEIRRMMRENGNSWEQVVEILIASESQAQEEQAVRDIVTAPLRNYQNSILAASISSDGTAIPGHLSPPTSLPDHMRQWRASSPASVDTSGTHSSADGGSSSTSATTDEGANSVAAASPDTYANSRGSTPLNERLCNKRAASSDPNGHRFVRSPKRSSRSRSPSEDREPSQSFSGIYPSSPLALSSPADAVSTESSSADASEPEEKTVIAPVKRGRGRPRKDGLPVNSTPRRKVPTAREKRDAAAARRRERQLEKLGRTRIVTDDRSNQHPSAEVRGFRELKI
ncbi:cysteine proteinase [Violaceomyces palustris]|uniref:Cysteine proteinase n=1 Tax=Violaceomyces palustris TaxID=1673888 RepID=A0ACD0NWN4_9BASI|nr:cysteine proteinase [Violaceomyces palustris]